MTSPSSKSLNHFKEKYRESRGDLYFPNFARDLKILKEVSDQLGEERTQKTIDLFFSVPQKAYTVPYYKACINDLVNKTRERDVKPLSAESSRFED